MKIFFFKRINLNLFPHALLEFLNVKIKIETAPARKRWLNELSNYRVGSMCPMLM